MDSQLHYLHLFIQAVNLKDLDTFSKSDPYVKVLVSDHEDNLIKIDDSEVKKNNLNPYWRKQFIIPHHKRFN